MARITWDDVGDRFYESGVDRGVLYLPSKPVTVEGKQYPSGVAWNGLTSVDTTAENESTTPMYFDGVKKLDLVQPGDFSASLKAFTYPDEFMLCSGYAEFETGIYVDNQDRGMFGLSYRTRVGNDLNSELGYKIHILYNLTAVEDAIGYKTQGNAITPIEFSWTLTSLPIFTGRRPAAHIIIDSTKIDPDVVVIIEDMLYGTDTQPARLPHLTEILGNFGVMVFINLENPNKFTAIGPDDKVSMITENAFEIDTLKATFVDANTWEILPGF